MTQVTGPAGPTAPGRAPSTPAAPAEPSWRERVNEHPMAPYYLILGSAMLLLVLGLVMVLSSSSVESYDTTGSAFTLFTRQAMFATAGLVAMVVLSRMPVPVLRRFSTPFMIGAAILLLLLFVPGIGVSVAGQRNWIDLFGPFRLQPSEFAKLALILWAADLFTRRERVLDEWRQLAWPFLGVAGLVVGVVVLQGDLGTAIILAIIVAGLLFVAGAPMRIFVGLGVLGVAGIAALSLTAGYRIRRFTAWLHPEGDLDGAGWQLLQGKYALGTGGWWGVGLGGSREKWGALPAAHTDFIFPVIGEELGLLGALTVVGLFAAITVFTMRMAIRTNDVFVRVVCVGIIAWLMGQAMVNLGAVLQLLPITGVTLPFVSYGGSSLLPSLMAIGILLAFAKHEAGGAGARRRAAPVGER
ncbi:MAG: putative lipid II flippase FtsW [Candidatus Nanopelagicales bacterium]|nr:putative lipid II flippase FtsW [Candidatus Nanopelagicales bacterium]